MDCIVHGVTKSRTRLSDFHTKGMEHFCYDSLPQLMGSHIVRVP